MRLKNAIFNVGLLNAFDLRPQATLDCYTVFDLPSRKSLCHEPPYWLKYQSETWFITVNCRERGHNQLCHSGVAEVIFESVRFRNEQKVWFCELLLLMPDHLHALISVHPDSSLRKVVSDWKRWLARNHDLKWQANFFDHRIRNDASLHEKWLYILNNPVKKGYCSSMDDWEFVWCDLEDGKGLRMRNA
ncbi:REP-associated tyrosine transposase [Rubritalea spongiae]